MNYLAQLRARRGPNMLTPAPLKTFERLDGPRNTPTPAPFKTFKRCDVDAFEGFEGHKGEHISGVPAVSQAADTVLVDERDLAVSNLRNSPAPHDYSPGLWIDTLAGMDAFCATWADRARALGWRESELFGLDDHAPAARHDKRGLALSLTGGARVVRMDAKGAEVQMPSGAHLRFYRRSGQERY
jgi:hypothetical protein